MAADEENRESAEQPPSEQERTPADGSSHAVPSDEAKEIASEVEDAPLEAAQEAAEHPAAEQAEPPSFTPAGEGHAAASEEALEIAGVAEDAALEAAQEAEDRRAQAAAVSEEPDSDGEGQAAEAAAQPEADTGADAEAAAARRVKPSVPGAHLEVDIVPEGEDPLGREEYADPYALEEELEAPEPVEEAREEELAEPIATAAIDLASGARYRATGKRKTAIARVTLRPGDGSYQINGRPLEAHFPRLTLQRNIRQPLETVGYQERMDVVARLHGGGISAQADALRHGVARALLEADPNLRGELKRRGFLTRDSRAKERKKAGLKKARKRPQFSKR